MIERRVWYRRLLDRAGLVSRARSEDGRFKSLIENSVDLIAIMDRDARFLYTSPGYTTQLGYGRDELLGKPANDYIHPEDIETVREALTHLKGGVRGPVEVQQRFRNKGGEWRLVSSFITNLLSDPSVHGLVVNSRDVTTKRELENRVSRSQQLDLVGQLAGGMAHEFNNLLTVIRVHSEFLLEDLRPENALRADADAIHKAANRAAELTRRLLTLSRKHLIEPQILDLSEFVREMTPMLNQAIGERIQLETKCLPDCTILADPNQLQQVVLNLVFNARDAMPEGGKLSIETEIGDPCPEMKSAGHEEPCVILRVRDSGTGMTETAKERVFEPFFTTKGQGKGTGLGLSTAYAIVRQSGGYMDFDSEPGVGTTMSIYFPKAQQQSAQAAPMMKEPIAGPRRVLLVDDEDAVRMLARRILERNGYVVFDAGGARDALDIVAKLHNDIDLLVSDIRMPEINGPELADLIREDNPELPILFISGFSDGKLQRDGLGRGMAFLQKPFTESSLMDAVRNSLALADAAASTDG
jgi:PAS domain S-box-containing protein